MKVFNCRAPVWGGCMYFETPPHQKKSAQLIKKANFLHSGKRNDKNRKETSCLIPMASGFCCLIFWEKVRQRRWRGFLSGLAHFIFLSSIELWDCSDVALWVLVQAKSVTKQHLELILIQSFRGRFSFLGEQTWGILHVFPWNWERIVSFFSHHFGFWDVGCCSGFSPCHTKLFICIPEGCGENEQRSISNLISCFHENHCYKTKW